MSKKRYASLLQEIVKSCESVMRLLELCAFLCVDKENFNLCMGENEGERGEEEGLENGREK